MRNFDNNDFFNNDDDFMDHWRNFNNRMMNDEEFRKEMEKAQKDFKELMRAMLNQRNFGTPLDFRIIPLNMTDFRKDFKIPENEMDIEKGQDESGEWETKSWTSPDGSLSYSFFSRSSGFDDMSQYPDEIAERWKEKMNKKKEADPEMVKYQKLAKLKNLLDKAVETEDYEKAAEIKKIMDEIKSEKKETK